MDSAPKNQMSKSSAGLLSGLTAYMLWGLFPIYFMVMRHVPVLELLAHRVVWSIPTGLIVLLFRKQIGETIKAISNPKVLVLLIFSAVAIALNWGIYIWAIQKGEVFQASLGYYINPLFNVLFGVILFKEKLSRLQVLAILCAFIGVMILTINGGVFPYISLSLAVSFGLYGVLRKIIKIGAMPGLFIETTLIFIPSLLFLVWLNGSDKLIFLSQDIRTDLLLIFAGPLTVFPLLAFAFAARNIKFSTLGIIQYVGPTLQFICALYYGEKFTRAYALCFGFIWIGIAIFVYAAIKDARRQTIPADALK